MPFRSEKQRRFMFSQHPEIARRWEAEGKAYIKKKAGDSVKKKIMKKFPPKRNDHDADDMMKKAKSKAKKKGKNWIAGAIKHPGALHRALGVKQGNKIPSGKLANAARRGGKVGREARLAQTLKGFHKRTPKKALKGKK